MLVLLWPALLSSTFDSSATDEASSFDSAAVELESSLPHEVITAAVIKTARVAASIFFIVIPPLFTLFMH